MPTYTQSSPISINDNATANPYPSLLTLSGFNGTITGVTVTLHNINHTYPDDIDILLVGPQGQTVVLMSDVGGGTGLSGINLTFDDSAVNSLPDSSAIASGTYKPTDIVDGTDSFGTPAPTGTYGSSLSVFNGTNANGVWKLFVVDDTGSDVGTIDGGWSLNITTTDSSGTPIGQATSTFNIAPDTDVIVNRTGGVTDTTQTSIDLGGNAFVTQSFAAYTDSINGNGLPDTGFFAANSYHPSIQLGYSNSDNGNNARLITTSTGSFTVNIPSSQYRAIHLAVTSTEASSNIRLTLNYTDGTSETTTTQTIPDWFNEITESKDLYYLINGLDRAKADGTTFQNSNDPALFGVRFLVNSAKTLQNFTVEKTASTGRLVVFGATGVLNSSPSGNLTITGTATENQTLTATNTLVDGDGLGTLNYQWQQSTDGTTWTNISGETSNSLTLGNSQVGQQIRVQVSYTDGNGTLETVNSSATTAVVNINDNPTGSVNINGTAAKNQTLTATNTLVDADGLGTLNYQWQQSSDGTTWTNISGETSNSLTLGNSQVGQQIRVQVSYTDGNGTLETVNSSATTAVVNINDNPTGSVNINGTAAKNQTLTATNTLVDADGLGTLNYQWQQSTDGTTWTNISGETSNSLTLGNSQVGQQIRVQVSYTDGNGTLETVNSSATTAVVNINDNPTGSVNINGTAAKNQTLTATNTLVDADGLGTLNYQWQQSTDGTTWTNISGETSNSLTLGNSQVGQQIRVQVSYTDGHGTLETVNSSATSAVTNINDAPTGNVTITGTATENQTLTATNTLVDADGLGTLNYQWQQSSDGTTWTNISGETSNSLTLGNSQVGQQIRVQVSYTDGNGTLETVNSSATTAVVNINDAPTGSVNINGTAAKNQTLTATNTLADADGLGTLNYQWQQSSDGTTWTNISGETSNSLTLGNSQVGQQIRVQVSYTDGHGTLETVNSSATTAVVNINDAPTGNVTITGTATENQTLTATNTLVDADGLGTLNYQWQQSTDGTTWTNISGETSNSLTLGNSQVGQQIRVQVSYTDGNGTLETVNSSATTAVVNINDNPTGSVNINGTAAKNQTLTATNTLVDADGLGTLNYQWQQSTDGTTWTNISGETSNSLTLGNSQVGQQIRVQVSYTDGHGTLETVNSSATSAVTNINDAPTGNVTITGTATENQTLTATNTLVDADGLGTLNYQWQQSTDGTSWTNISGATNTTLTLGDNQVGEYVRVQVSYTDGNGTLETVNSSATTAVVNINDAPTGSVNINGTATENQILTATDTLADADGIETLNYQWQESSDGTNWTNINSATNTSLTLGYNQVGKYVRVQVSYTDGHGTLETVNSSATDVVTNININHPPTGNVTITGTATEDQTLTATNNLADVDGLGTLNYQWQQSTDGTTWTNINGATNTTLTLGDNYVGKQIRVQVSYTDGNGTLETVNSDFTIPVVNVNDAPTGSVTISGITQDNQTLTATNTLADIDGLGTLNYQWQQTTDGTNWTNISGATNANLILAKAQVGKQVRIQVSYTDGNGTLETVNSSPTGIILHPNNTPTGSVTITGTATEDQTLTATNTLADADGLGFLKYQWQQSTDGTNWTNIDVSPYLDTLTLGGGEVGKYVRVRVSYTDGYGVVETVDSLPTSIVANVNDAPTGNIDITGRPQVSNTLTATNNLADADGLGTLNYQWQQSSDVTNWTNISGANNATLTLGEAQLGKYVRLQISYTDGYGTSETVNSSFVGTVFNVNSAPTGTVTITGTLRTDNTLTATNTLADVDGLGPLNYQWQQSTNGTNWTDINGATDTVFTLGSDQLGKYVRGKVSYTDGNGVLETVYSNPTSAIETSILNFNINPTDDVIVNWHSDGFYPNIADLDTTQRAIYGFWSLGTQSYANYTNEYFVIYGEKNGKSFVIYPPYVHALPNNGFFPANTYHPEIQLGYNNADDGNNAVLLNGQQNFTVNLPTNQYGQYSSIHLAVTSAVSADFSLTLNYTDGTSETTGNYSVPSWDTQITESKDLYYLDTGLKQALIGGNDRDYSGWLDTPTVSLFGVRVWVNSAKTLQSFKVINTSENSALAVLGTTGVLNTSPSGKVTIDGVPRTTQILTATNTLADADNGLGTLNYQWQQSTDSINWTNINGATNSTLTLADAQLNQQVRVKVSYTDGTGTLETVYSDPTQKILALNNFPTGSVTITGTAAEDQTLTATNTLADDDGLGTLNYQWQDSTNGINWTNITGATNSTLTLADAQVNKQVRVRVSYTDGKSNLETVYSSSTNTVTNVNDAVTGSVTITGTAAEKQTLTATNTLADDDGLGTLNYQWQQSSDGTTWTNINNAINSSFTLSDAQIDQFVRVQVSYTDGHGTLESVNSSATDAVTNVNDAPTGNVTITGTATEKQTLTATNTLADADGLGTLSYQWQQSTNGVTWSNISGATNTNLILSGSQIGKKVRVRVSYTDGYGTLETVYSSATNTVTNANDAPTGSVTITGTVTEDQTLTATNTLADADGLGTLNYQWQQSTNGTNWTNINGATNSSLTLSDAQVGQFVRVQVSYTDGYGTLETVNSLPTSAVTNVNDALTGNVTITGTATEDQTLTATNTLADVDGVGTLNYQWQQSSDGINWTNINDAVNPTLTLADAQVGKYIQVRVQYVDGHGTLETVYSNITSLVGNINDTPTGSVTITGATIKNQTLTANNTLADADGLGTLNYQWQESTDGTTWTNINGATNISLTLGEAQLDKYVRVRVNYTDGYGTSETVYSNSTSQVADVNHPPTGSVTISGIVEEDQTLTATHTLADVDGLGTLNYQWQESSDGTTWTNIDGATNTSLTLGDAQPGKYIRTQVSYIDGRGASETVYSLPTDAVANINDLPTGSITINGIVTEDQTLTVTDTLADADGLGEFSYQWQQSTNGTTWININDATNSSLTLGDALVGKYIQVRISYTDGYGTLEGVNSTPTAKVVNVNDSPTGSITINGIATQNQTLTLTNTLADADGLLTLNYQWQQSTDGTTWTNISGATNTSLTLGDAQVDRFVRIKVSYTDGNGTLETVNSLPTSKVAYFNHVPTGSVTVTGTVREDQTLNTVNILEDVDGLGTFNYQWQQSTDGTTWTNINGATNTTLTLGDAQVAKQIRVQVSYTDGHGTLETVNSSATSAVTNINDVPTGNVTITGTTTEDQILTANNTLADGDGLGTLNYQWQQSTNSTTWTNISGATNTTLTLGDGQVGKYVRVQVSYTDGNNTLETVNSSSTNKVANVNDAPTGSVTLTGTTTEDQTLTATNTLADLDGLGTLKYQWQQTTDGTTWTNISGATNTSLTLGDGHVGKYVRLQVSYTDGNGTLETVNSSPTPAVANVNDTPTGSVTLTGKAVSNETLTATNTLADVDGLGTLSYQWQETTDGTTWTDISGATNSSLLLTDTFNGKKVRVGVSYTDGYGTSEKVYSSTTNAIYNPTINVTQSTDDGLGTTEGTLSWAIQTANTRKGFDIISLQNNVRLNFGDSLKRMVPLIDSDITFEGNSYTISGDNNNDNKVDAADRPIFFVKSGNVTFKNLTLRGGVANPDKGGAGMGGAMFIAGGNVTINQVSFTNNQALGSSRGKGGGNLGLSGTNGSNRPDGETETNSSSGLPIKVGTNGGNGDFGGNGGNGSSLNINSMAGKGGNGGFGGAGGNGGNNSNQDSFAHGGPGGNGDFGGAGGNGGSGPNRGGSGFGGYGAPAGKTGSGSEGSYTRQGTGGFGASGSASAGMGGAIFIYSGNLEIQNSSFTDNSAKGVTTTNDGKTEVSSGFGGAIYDYGGYYKFYGTASYFIRISSIKIASNTTFTNNYASSGNATQDAIGDNLNTQAVYGTTSAVPITQASALGTELVALSAENNPIVIQNEPTSADPGLEDSGIDYSTYNLENLNFSELSPSVQENIKTAFGLSSTLDLSTFDPAVAAANGDSDGVTLLSNLFAIQTAITQMAAALQGTLPDQSSSALQTAVLQSIQQQILDQASLGQTVDFSDTSQLSTILTNSIADLQAQEPTLDLQAVTDNQTQLLEVMAASNQQILDVLDPENTMTPQEAVAQIYKARQVSLNEVANDLKDATAGTQTLTDVVNQNTGTNLTNQVQAAVAPINPAAANDDFSRTENQTLTGNVFSDNGRGTDIDFNASPLTIIGVNDKSEALGQQITLVSGALVTLNSDGTFSYDPNGKFKHLGAGETGTDSFTYQIRNNDNLTDIGTVTITFTGENDVPTTVSLADRGFTQNSTIDTSLANLSNDDLDTNDATTYTLVTGTGSTDNGRFQVVNNQLQFKTWLDFDNGRRYNVRVKTTDSQGATTETPLEVHSYFQNRDINLSVNDLQSGASGLTLDSVGNAVNGTVSMASNQVLFTPTSGFLGIATFDYTVIDNNQQVQTHTANLAIMPFAGKQTVDTLTGTSADDVIVGLQGKDVLTGGGGSDRYVYTSITDNGDTLNDFGTGDKIDLAAVLDNIGYLGSSPISDQYVRFLAQGSNTIVQIDPDGIGSAKANNFILVKGIDATTLNNVDNFIF